MCDNIKQVADNPDAINATKRDMEKDSEEITQKFSKEYSAQKSSSPLLFLGVEDFENIEDNKQKNVFRSNVYEITNELAEMLISKNAKYGNSALEPKRIFSKASPVEQILVRLDDKLSRLANDAENEDEDIVADLLGYLVLLKIAKNKV